MSLNGQWQTLPIKGLDFQFPPPAQGWQPETVPHEKSSVIESIGGPYAPGGGLREIFNAEGAAFKNEKMAAWLKRDFSLPAGTMTGKRAVLYFGGMAFRSDTWLNGKKLGTSVLGQVPISYDVTSLLKPGANQLVVGLAGREGIIDLKEKTYIAPPSGVQSGIWGDVELRLLPEVSVEDVFIKTSVKDKRIDLEITAVNAGAHAPGEARSADLRQHRQRAAHHHWRASLAGCGQSKTFTSVAPWANPNCGRPNLPRCTSPTSRSTTARMWWIARPSALASASSRSAAPTSISTACAPSCCAIASSLRSA
jgi:beta-galactosidase